MTRIAYIQKRFGPRSKDAINKANAVCAAYQAQGYDLTLRQLYYQFVSRGWIANTLKEYKRLGDIINNARLAGLLDWDYIVDRTRNMEKNSHWNTPADIIRSAARTYAQDKWAQQNTYVEVWIEKNALVGVLEQICPQNDVPYFACVGYPSSSEVWGAAQRLGEKIDAGKKVIIIHLGDHDPSGLDMSRDIEDRLRMFIAQDVFGASPVPSAAADDYSKDEYLDITGEHLEIDRIALNTNQIQQYNPPANPAKLTDSRAGVIRQGKDGPIIGIKPESYIDRFSRLGRDASPADRAANTDSWELDALDPATLTALIQDAIDSYKDPDVWQEAVDEEERQREILTKASARWTAVAEFLEAEAS